MKENRIVVLIPNKNIKRCKRCNRIVASDMGYAIRPYIIVKKNIHEIYLCDDCHEKKQKRKKSR